MKIKWLWTISCVALMEFLNPQFLQADSSFSIANNLILPIAEFKTAYSDGNYNFGLSAFSNKICKQISFVVKSGNLGTGGALSTMNSPLLSSASSPFDSGSTTINCVSTSLPGITSFSRPVSTFVQLEYNNRNFPLTLMKTNCFYSPEENVVVFSTYEKINLLKKKLVLQSSQTIGNFFYEENSQSSWILDEEYFSAGKHVCSLFQFSASVPKFTLAFTLGLYETPFGKVNTIYRGNLNLKTNHFIFTFSTLYFPEKLTLTSSEKKLSELFQLKSGIQYKTAFMSKTPWFLKSGFTFYGKFFPSEIEHDISTAAGIQLSTLFTSISLTGNASFTMKTNFIDNATFEINSLSLKLKNSWTFKYINPAFSLGTTFTFPEDLSKVSTKTSGTFKLTYNQFPKISTSTSISVTKKENFYTNKTLSSSCTLTMPFKYYKCTMKITANINI